MKRLTALLGILALVGAVAVPVFALGPGWGWGYHMMGYWGGGYGYAGNYENLAPEQRAQLDALSRQFYDETTDLRNHIWSRSSELNVLLDSPNPDLDKVKALQKEIADLWTKLDDKQLNYELQTRKISPQGDSGGPYAGWYGHHMGGFGPGMGYGPGACWN
jgi:zinc resistance-associated protein